MSLGFKKHTPLLKTLQLAIFLVIAFTVTGLPTVIAATDTDYDTFCITGGDCAFYDPEACGTVDSGSTTDSVGGDTNTPAVSGGSSETDSEKIVWNYFKNRGLSDAQLDLVWQHMQNNPVVTKPFDLAHFKSLKTESEADIYFGSQIEGFGIAGNRLAYATTILHQAQAQGWTGSVPNAIIDPTGCSPSTSGSPDCQAATGNTKILCEAKKYEGIYYRWGGGHQGISAFTAGCPDPANPPNNYPNGSATNGDPGGLSGNPSPCATDCSGLVSIALDEAFNQTYMWTAPEGSNPTMGMGGDGGEYWKSIPISEATAGDIVTNPGHVEIVDHVTGNTVYTFGSHATGKKTGPITTTSSYWKTGAWHWTGPGSGS
jgi:hypothetical protein